MRGPQNQKEGVSRRKARSSVLTTVMVEDCPRGVEARGWVAGDLGESDFVLLENRGGHLEWRGIRMGAWRGPQAWTGVDRALSLGWHSLLFLSWEGCSSGGKAVLQGRGRGLARAVTSGWEEGMGPSTLLGHWARGAGTVGQCDRQEEGLGTAGVTCWIWGVCWAGERVSSFFSSLVFSQGK